MTEEKAFDVIPELIDDAFVLTRCEYMIQLSYYTPDLHVTRGWSLITKEQRERFNKYASNLGGHVIQCIYELSELPKNQNFDTIFGENKIIVNSKSMVFKSGALPPPKGFDSNPMGVYRFGIFTIALGPILMVDSIDGIRSSAPFPPGYMCRSWQCNDSINVPSSRNSFTANYQVKFCDQILPTMLIEIEFKPLRIEISQPICEMCDINISTLYCESDKAHLCASCDEFHHSSSRLLSKHQRVPVSQSPYQFGFCPHHSTERIDSVCMNCYISLCPHCILIGQHSSGDAAEHILISTTDAIRMAYSGVSQSDLELQKRKKQLADYLSGRHNHINDIRSNYDEIQERIEIASKSLLQQLASLRERKISFIMSIKRQLLTELLLIEWMEAFFAHLRLALLPSDFLVYSHRHDLVCSYFFGGKSNIVVSNEVLPSWILEKFFVDGGFNVISRSGEADDMLSILKENQNGLEDGFNDSNDENLDSLNALKKKFEYMDDIDEGESTNLDESNKLNKNAVAKWDEFSVGEVSNKSICDLSGKNLPIEQKLLTSEEYNACKLPSLGTEKHNKDENNSQNSFARYPELRTTKLMPQMRDLVEKLNPKSRNLHEYYYSKYDVDDLVENVVSRVQEKLNGISTTENDEEVIWLNINNTKENDINNTIDNILLSRNNKASKNISIWDPSVDRPSELAKEYWRFLVGYNYELLIALLHSAPSLKRKNLIQDVFNLSIYMQSFDHLFYSLFHFEINFLSNIPIDTMLLSSSVINDFFHIMLKANSLTKVDRLFLVQYIQIVIINILNIREGPYVNHIGKTLNIKNSNKNELLLEQHELDKGLIEFEEKILETTENFIRQITSLDINAIPDTLRGILYGIIDIIDSISSEAHLKKSKENNLNHLPSRSQKVIAYCTNGSISFCCQILLNHYIIPRISNVIASLNYTLKDNNNQSGTVTKKTDIIARIQCFRRALSAISIYVWEPSTKNTPEKNLNNLEQKYRELGLQVFSWLQKIFKKPRLVSPIIFNIVGMPERGINSIDNIKNYMIWLDNALRNDQLKSDGGMGQKEILNCQYFEKLLSLAIKGLKN
ncbi:B-box zinc finger domain-containing protein [Cryptosporidium ubiquitum]|uniref:B-box zinc finger domain-containing protein n=1 Tax=Cryptosporidium ubiquitum TaxID=857276 RepID=A0A1J4MI55_9CRYT|nr:B-box zinc finger domain-containing protein [Cryptosporidium ubiquitum]OII72708.1 B-box zinc finger domain-containing protein [Cryptosporidium ubiquitum]